ncbi:hypothetical protein AH97_23145 [Salmonella enterica subsp. enterica]|mgnify:CR=1|nr:hypothetical protein [Salmonella enterica subsp. enterica serovar Hartford]
MFPILLEVINALSMQLRDIPWALLIAFMLRSSGAEQFDLRKINILELRELVPDKVTQVFLLRKCRQIVTVYTYQ